MSSEVNATGQSSRLLGAVALITLLLFWVTFLLKTNRWLAPAEVDMFDVVSEIFTIAFIVTSLGLNILLRTNTLESRSIYAGLCCLLVGHIHDLLDEFIIIEPQVIHLILENMANNLGILIVSYAMFKWANHYKQQLRVLNQQTVALTSASITDPLTNLYNRRFCNSDFQQQLEDNIAGGAVYSVVMLDLDRFKQFNDTYGHPEGDKLIRHAADCIRAAIRDEDFAFRYGGEEFLVVINSNAEAAMRVAERIRSSYQDSHFRVQDDVITKSVSIGVAELDIRDGFSCALTKADAALYRAKHSGRNKVVLAETGGASLRHPMSASEGLVPSAAGANTSKVS